MSTHLIVPSRHAVGKPGRRPDAPTNAFASMLRRRRNGLQRRYRGPVWKGVEEHAGGLQEAPGRKVGRTAGGYIEDLVQLRKSIVLCCGCASRFFYQRASYYKDGRYGPRVVSSCDGCRDYTSRGQLFLPEERLIDSNGIAQPGQVWDPA